MRIIFSSVNYVTCCQCWVKCSVLRAHATQMLMANLLLLRTITNSGLSILEDDTFAENSKLEEM